MKHNLKIKKKVLIKKKLFNRLASVQEQRIPCGDQLAEDPPRSADVQSTNKVFQLFIFITLSSNCMSRFPSFYFLLIFVDSKKNKS